MFEDPTKVFPCDCMGEGISVTKDYYDSDQEEQGEVAVSTDSALDDCSESPYIQLSFWEFGHSRHGRWSLWQRIKMAYQIAFRNKGPWEDMVMMRAPNAKHFANHILYIIAKGEREKKLGEPIVKDPEVSEECDQVTDWRKLYPEDKGGKIPAEDWDQTPKEFRPTEPIHSYFCVQHGGSPKCEESNKKYGLTCPKCDQDSIVEEIKGGGIE